MCKGAEVGESKLLLRNQSEVCATQVSTEEQVSQNQCPGAWGRWDSVCSGKRRGGAQRAVTLSSWKLVEIPLAAV